MKAPVSLLVPLYVVVALLLATDDIHAQNGYDLKHLRSFAGANGLGPEAGVQSW